MNLVTALGLLAGTLTTVAFVPQVIRTWKSKSTKDLSLPMLVSFTTGVLCWLIYGIWIDSLPITLTNGPSCWREPISSSSCGMGDV